MCICYNQSTPTAPLFDGPATLVVHRKEASETCTPSPYHHPLPMQPYSPPHTVRSACKECL
jgi:hypothetical protein